MYVVGRIIAIAALLAASPAAGDDSPWDYDMNSMAGFKPRIKGAEMITRINSDRVLRAIVCRVPFTDISVRALIQATKLPGKRVMSGVRGLVDLGLVTVSQNETSNDVIKPKSEEARAKMRDWAYQWCSSDDKCGVAW